MSLSFDNAGPLPDYEDNLFAWNYDEEPMSDLIEFGVSPVIPNAPSTNVPSPSSDQTVDPGRGQELLRLSQHPIPRSRLNGTSIGTATIDITTQISGKFFVPEFPWAGVNQITSKVPELTCYRRNLFKVYGSVLVPRNFIPKITHDNGNKSVEKLIVQLSASDTVDNRPIKLISVPVRRTSSTSTTTPETDPRVITLDLDLGSQLTHPKSFPIAWDRLQFRNATAKNYRRASSQQLYSLEVLVNALLSDGSTVEVARASSTPIVVRGSTPRNYQARKESLHRRQSSNVGPEITNMNFELSPQNSSLADESNYGQLNRSVFFRSTPLLITTSQGQGSSAQSPLNLSTISANAQTSESHVAMDVDQILSTTINNATSDYYPEDLISRSGSSVASDSLPKAASEPITEDATLTYEYYPLSIDDWTVPIEAIYRPHFVHQREKRPERLQSEGDKRFYKR